MPNKDHKKNDRSNPLAFTPGECETRTQGRHSVILNMQNCDNILYLTIPPCKKAVKLDAGLEPETDYVVQITDKFRTPRTETITTDAEGILQITTGETACGFPAHWFNPFAGSFLIEIFQADGTTPVGLIMCDEEEPWDAISLKVEGDPTEEEPYLITCPGENTDPYGDPYAY